MKNNETGEFELVVGNRQLLSAFAIVVLLFGVGVAMGYILGQNSPKSAKLQPDAAQPAVTDQRPQPAAPAAPPPQPAAAATDAAATQPVSSGDSAAASPATQPAAQPAAEPVRDPAPTPAAAAGNTVAEPPPGSYWQVMALPEADAEGVLRTLKEQGFPALLSPGTKNLTRVLVGPFKDTQSMGRAKTQLESAGFHPVKKSSE